MRKNIIYGKFCTPTVINNDTSKCISVSSNAKDTCVKISSTSESIVVKSDIIRPQETISQIPILEVYEITNYKMMLDNIKYVERNDKIKIKITNYKRSNEYLKLSTNISSSIVFLKKDTILLNIGKDALDGEKTYVELASTEIGKKESELGYSEEFILKKKSIKPILRPLFSGVLYEYEDIKYEILGDIKYERVDSSIFSTSSSNNKGFASLKDNIVTVRLPYSSNSVSDIAYINITFFEINKYSSEPFEALLKIISKVSSGTRIISTVNIGSSFQSSSDYNQVFFTDKTYVSAFLNYGNYVLKGMQRSKYKQSNKFEIVGMRKDSIYKFFLVERLFDLYKAVNNSRNEVSYSQAILSFTHEKYRDLSLIVFDVTNNIYSISGLYVGWQDYIFPDQSLREMFTHGYSKYALRHLLKIVSSDTMSLSFSESGGEDKKIKKHIYFDNNIKLLSRAIQQVTGTGGIYSILVKKKTKEVMRNIEVVRTYILRSKVVEYEAGYKSSTGYYKVCISEFGFIQARLTKYIIADKKSINVQRLLEQIYIKKTINEIEEISSYSGYIYNLSAPFYVDSLSYSDTVYDFVSNIVIKSASYNGVGIDLSHLKFIPEYGVVYYKNFNIEYLATKSQTITIEYEYIGYTVTNIDGDITISSTSTIITLTKYIKGRDEPLYMLPTEKVMLPIDSLNDSVLAGAFLEGVGIYVDINKHFMRLPSAVSTDLYTKHKILYHTTILKE